MNAGTKFLLMTVRTGGLPRRRAHLRLITKVYVSALVAVVLGIALSWL